MIPKDLQNALKGKKFTVTSRHQDNGKIVYELTEVKNS